MTDANEWQLRLLAMLEAELDRQKISHCQLAAMVSNSGSHTTVREIIECLSTAEFDAPLFFRCLTVMKISFSDLRNNFDDASHDDPAWLQRM